MISEVVVLVKPLYEQAFQRKIGNIILVTESTF